MVFFFVYFSQTCLSIFQAIGMNDSGYCGFITAISHYGGSAGNIIVGILLTMIALCFAVCAAANIMMITKVLISLSKNIFLNKLLLHRSTPSTEVLALVWLKLKLNSQVNLCEINMSNKLQHQQCRQLWIPSSTPTRTTAADTKKRYEVDVEVEGRAKKWKSNQKYK